MLMNNLDKEVAEHPPGPRRLRRIGAGGALVGGVRRHLPRARRARRRRDAPRPVRQAGRRRADPPVCAAGADRERQPRSELGDARGVPPPRDGRPHDVRPDDGRIVDLHRDARDPAGDLRNLRRGGGEAFRRDARWHPHRHRRPRRNGGRATARRDDERWGRPLCGMRCESCRATTRDPLPRRSRRRPRRRRAARAGGKVRAPGAFGRGRRQRRRGAATTLASGGRS